MDKEHFLHFKIISVKQETSLAKTFRLELLNKASLNFKPGQFLTFIIHTEKQELRRSYSILSLPSEPLEVTIKKVENGLISRYILQHWKEGEIIYSLPPAGRFTVEAQKKINRDIFCFAAGSGIVPILPQVRYLLAEEPQSIIHLIYSNHDENTTLFLDYIEHLSSVNTRLNLICLFSEPKINVHRRGHLSNISAEELIEKNLHYTRKDALFLICGPFTYMRMLNFTIGLMHFSKENIRRENFLPSVMQGSETSKSHFPDRPVEIKIEEKTYFLTVKSGESILDAGLKQDLNLPYSCKGGVCGNCVAKCLEGKVHMDINEVLMEADLKEGWVLTCTGYPETENVKIEFII